MTKIEVKVTDLPEAEDRILDSGEYGFDPEQVELSTGYPTSISQDVRVIIPEDVRVYKIRNKKTGVVESEVPNSFQVRELAKQWKELEESARKAASGLEFPDKPKIQKPRKH